MIIRKLVFATVGSAAMLVAGAAFAAPNSNSPPEPYTAVDPVYTPHKVQSDVTMHTPKDNVSLTDNGSASTKSGDH